MLEDFPLIPLSWRSWLLSLIATVITTGLITTIVTKWLERKKYKAEVAQTDATTVEIRTRTRLTEADAIGKYREWLTEAQEQIDALRDENLELQSRALELIGERSKLTVDLAQANTDIELKEIFIARLHAATKLGMELKDLPPSLQEVIDMLEAIHITRLKQ